MIRKAPPLQAIEIFVAAANGESFRSVARNMALSPSAVSRRIASLEAFLGVSLFHRHGQTQVLSSAGRRYLALVEPALGAIQQATSLLAETDKERLRVATSHSFASIWLLSRLPDLLNKYGIDVELVLSRDFNVLRSGDAQIGIWGGLPVPPDMIAERLFDVEAFPVSAPCLADGRLPPATDERLPDFPLLSVSSPERLWQRWFTAAGQDRPLPPARVFDTLQLMYEAAAAGLGIALAVPLVSEPFLASGRLVRCGQGCQPLGEAYYLYRAGNRVARTGVEQRFATWLNEAVHRSLDDFARFTKCREPDASRTSPPTGRLVHGLPAFRRS